MKPEVKEKWLEALRGGEYSQTLGRLKRSVDNSGSIFPVGFCCLGVLCDLASKEGVGEWDGNDQFVTQETLGVDNKDPSTLLGAVRRWSGIEDSAGQLIQPIRLPEDPAGFNPGRKARSLASANDGGLSFLEIADIIEQQF